MPNNYISLSGSVSLTGSLEITGSFLATASYANQALSASWAPTQSLALSSSFAQTASYFLTSSVTSASLAESASYFLTSSVTSASLAQSASYVENAQTASYFLTSSVTSASLSQTTSLARTIDILDGGGVNLSYVNFSNVIASGGVTVLGTDALRYQQSTSTLFARNITGSLHGTASWANNAISASYALTASVVVSASYAATASYSQNIIISGSVNNVDYIDFNTGSAVPTWKSGRVFWDNTDGALSVYNAEQDVTMQLGQENWTRVSNRTGATITNGSVVRILGAHGDVPEVVLAQSLAVSGSINLLNQILGVATHDIEDGSKGYVTTQGLVRGLNTNAFNEGDILFISTGSYGQLMNVAPSAPSDIIPVGICVKASPGTSGIIYVAVQEPIDFSDLSSVSVSGSYHYGDLWVYKPSGSFGVWTHTNQLSGSYELTGSLKVLGSITSSLIGTASWANNVISASYAATASILLGSVESASYAATASYVNNPDIVVQTLNGTVLTENTISVIGAYGPGLTEYYNDRAKWSIQSAFSINNTLVTASLPNLIFASINMFASCSAVTKVSQTEQNCVYIPSVIELGQQTFANCGGLVSASLPNVIRLASTQFSGCTSLQYVSLPGLSGSTALGTTTGSNSVFLNVPNTGYIELPLFYSSSAVGSRPDGDIQYLTTSPRAWTINWL